MFKAIILGFLLGIFLGVVETFALYKIKIQRMYGGRGLCALGHWVVRLGALGCLILGVLVINYFT